MVHISALNGDENMIRTLYLARANATIQDNEGIFLMDFANLMKKKTTFFKILGGKYFENTCLVSRKLNICKYCFFKMFCILLSSMGINYDV